MSTPCMLRVISFLMSDSHDNNGYDNRQLLYKTSLIELHTMLYLMWGQRIHFLEFLSVGSRFVERTTNRFAHCKVLVSSTRRVVVLKPHCARMEVQGRIKYSSAPWDRVTGDLTPYSTQTRFVWRECDFVKIGTRRDVKASKVPRRKAFMNRKHP